MCKVLAIEAFVIAAFEPAPEAAKTAMAIERSNDEPCFGTEAGDRFTVMRRAGHARPEFVIADLTLDVASLSEASGNPTRKKFGSWPPMSASTSIKVADSPNKETAKDFASVITAPALGARYSHGRSAPKLTRRRA